MTSNATALQLLESSRSQADAWQLEFLSIGEATVVDFGCRGGGTVEAGCLLADVCLGAADAVSLQAPDPAVGPWSTVRVQSTSPLWQCLGCQYAGWPVSVDSYFAMGSGPFRLLRGQEPVLQEYQLTEAADVAVGVLETARLPTEAVIQEIARQCGIAPAGLTLAVARTSSVPGRLQVAARSVETALHKLHELKFDLRSIRAGSGTAPLPPQPADDLTALGWTNDAVLYGGRVELTVEADDAEIEAVLSRVPSGSSEIGGRPFLEIFEAFDRDFYRIDPLLFSPAQVTLTNLRSGRQHSAGEVRPDILQRSFEGR